MNTPKIDKSTWGDGPWQTEPDRLDFVVDGLACMALRNPGTGSWCGYVGVPSDHPAYGKRYDSVDVDVHGGELTYSNRCSGHVCHEPQPGMPHDVWWLGFDCAHWMDLAPLHNSVMRSMGFGDDRGSVYRDLDYVRAEISSLARQLALSATASHAAS